MNGLEAIEFMKQGKMVISRHSCGDFIINKIVGNTVYYIYESSKDDDDWELDDCFDFTNTYEEYVEPKQLTGWERVGENESYYHISCNCYVEKLIEERCMEDKYYYEDANYFSTEEKAEEIDFKQTLFRKLQRFSDENGGNEIDWNDADQTKYGIVYETKVNAVSVRVCTVQRFGEVYFQSYEAAREAARLLKDDLIKYFTHDWGGENE